MQLALYYTQSCPYCIRVLTVLNTLAKKVELKNISTSGELRQELVKQGGKSQVPCLKIIKQDGRVTWLYESLDIIRFLRQLDGD